MKYSEFKREYKWAIKNFRDVLDMYAEDMNEIAGKVEIINYKKTGSKWTETDRTTEEMTRANYMNVVESIPFFRSLGGNERLEKNYTKFGFIPVILSSIPPDKSEKVVRKYSF